MKIVWGMLLNKTQEKLKKQPAELEEGEGRGREEAVQSFAVLLTVPGCCGWKATYHDGCAPAPAPLAALQGAVHSLVPTDDC